MTDLSKRKSYPAIIHASKKLFWKYGIKRVSVEEICKEANISKMTFYRMFKNKKELALHLLHKLYDEGFSDYSKIMEQEIPFPQKIAELVQYKYEVSQDLSKEFFTELYQSTDKDIQESLVKQLERSQSAMRIDFTKAMKEGWISNELSMEFIFYMLGVIQEKMLDPELLSLYNNMQEAALGLIQFFFYGISSSKKAN